MMEGREDTLVPLVRAEPRASSTRANPLLAPGTMIEHYEVRNVLGRGAMGVVYRARDRKLGREVAIKLCATEAEGDTCSMLCALLVREGQTMARLSHANLVAVHDIGQFNHCIYVAMEYVDGTSLRAWSSTVGGPRERVDAMLAAGRGLAHAHAAGVIHRDFKPENVMVGRDGAVKVTDFGLARILGAPLDGAGPAAACGCGPDTRTLSDDAVVGTPRYMAPEQIDGGSGDVLADQFSFAATTWEIVFGEPPFRASSMSELRAAIEAGDLADVTASESAGLALPLRRALRPAPGERYASLDDLLAALASA